MNVRTQDGTGRTRRQITALPSPTTDAYNVDEDGRWIAVPTARVPVGGRYQPDRFAGDSLPFETDEEPTTDLGRLARRLVIAGVLIVALAVLNIFVLRRWGMDLPPEILFVSFGVIATASLMSLGDLPQSKKPKQLALPHNDAGCAVGCCPGPRPLRAFRS